MELAASLKEMKASATPPKRTEDGSVLVVGSQENGHSSGPLSEVRLFSVSSRASWAMMSRCDDPAACPCRCF